MALVLWNQYSRMPVVEFASSTSAECAVPMMEKIFNTYGVPEEVKSDNGPPFNSKKFKEFAKEQGFNHLFVSCRNGKKNYLNSEKGEFEALGPINFDKALMFY